MSVLNVTMFEFENEESIDEFVSWYKNRGSYKDKWLSLFVETGDTSVIGISDYPTEEARSNADKLRQANASDS